MIAVVAAAGNTARLVDRAMTALAPDPLHAERTTRSLRSIAGMLDLADLEALVESIERAAGDLSRQLLAERYGQVTRRG